MQYVRNFAVLYYLLKKASRVIVYKYTIIKEYGQSFWIIFNIHQVYIKN